MDKLGDERATIRPLLIVIIAGVSAGLANFATEGRLAGWLVFVGVLVGVALLLSVIWGPRRSGRI